MRIVYISVLLKSCARSLLLVIVFLILIFLPMMLLLIVKERDLLNDPTVYFRFPSMMIFIIKYF